MIKAIWARGLAWIRHLASAFFAEGRNQKIVGSNPTGPAIPTLNFRLGKLKLSQYFFLELSFDSRTQYLNLAVFNILGVMRVP